MSFFRHRDEVCPHSFHTFNPLVTTTKQEIVFDNGLYKEVTKTVELDLRDIACDLTYHDFGLYALKKSGAIQHLKNCQFSDCSVDTFIASITSLTSNSQSNEKVE